MRSAFNSLVQSAKAVDGESMLKLLNSKLDMLVSIDNSASIELAVIQSLLGKPGEELLQGLAKKLLPSQAHPDMEIGACRVELGKLQHHALYKFLDKKGQSSVDAVLSLLTKLEGGVSPGQSGVYDKYMTEVLDAMAFFCRESAMEEQSEKIVYGRVALEARLAKANAEGAVLSLEELRAIIGFSWLVPERSA